MIFSYLLCTSENFIGQQVTVGALPESKMKW